MDNGALGIKNDLPTAFFKTVAEFHLLGIHKDGLIEAANFPKKVFGHEHKGSGDPVRLEDRLMRVNRLNQLAQYRQIVEEKLPSEKPAKGGKVAAGGLESSAWIMKKRTH